MRFKKNTTRFCNPFTIKCLACSEYIFKNKRHNAIQEEVKGEDYYGIKIYRFFIKCTGCKKTLTIKTDPKSGDYLAEKGCIRVFDIKKQLDIKNNNSDSDINKIKEDSDIKRIKEDIDIKKIKEDIDNLREIEKKLWPSMDRKQILEKLKDMVNDSNKMNEQFKEILKNLDNLDDIIKNGQTLSERVYKTFKLYSEFVEIIKN